MSVENITIAGLLERNANRAPDEVFAVFHTGSWTMGETLRRSRAVATGLAELDIGPGEHVASWLPNGPEGLLSLFGTNLAGAVQVPLNTAYRGGLLEHALNLVQAPLLVAHHELINRLDGLHLPWLRRLVVVGGTDVPALPGVEVFPWEQLESADPTPPDNSRRANAWDDMVIIYTSGTTGPSKGVRCSAYHHQGFAEWFRVGDLGADDRALISLPLFHVGGTGWVYAMLDWGGSVGLLPRFSTSTFWHDVRRLGATTATMIGSMGTFLLQESPQPDDADNPLRIALATPHIPEWERFAERFGVQLWSGYAMSEVPGPLRSVFPGGNLAGAGEMLPDGWQVRLVDEHDLEVPVGTPGELVVRHDRPWKITHGYLGMPEATAEAWQNGWFHTGDVMTRDSDGTYYFVDRRKDALRRRGENISSAEVEAEIRAHPDVVDAAVVAVPAQESDDDVLAFVVPAGGTTVDPAELLAFLIPRMPHYMVPRYIDLVNELPLTPTGKVRKVELRDRGVTATTWDREVARITVTSTRLSPLDDPRSSGDGYGDE